MADSINKIDLSNLPQIAKQELYDFYQFLMQKYTKKEQSNNKELNIFPKKVHSFTPLKREDIYAR